MLRALSLLCFTLFGGGVAATDKVLLMVPLNKDGEDCALAESYKAIATTVIDQTPYCSDLSVEVEDIGVSSSETVVDGLRAGSESSFEAVKTVLDMSNTIPDYKAILGPVYSYTALQVHPIARLKEKPMVVFAPTSPTLGGFDYLARYGANSIQLADAVVALIKHYEWKSFALITSSDLHGQGFLQAALQLTDKHTEVTAQMQFTPHGTNKILFEDEAKKALERIKEGTSRIIVLSAHTSDAIKVMELAKEEGMTGKGWVWVAPGWCTDYGLDENEALKKDLAGLIGVRPHVDEPAWDKLVESFTKHKEKVSDTGCKAYDEEDGKDSFKVARGAAYLVDAVKSLCQMAKHGVETTWTDCLENNDDINCKKTFGDDSVTGNFEMKDGSRVKLDLDVVNLQKDGEQNTFKVVGEFRTSSTNVQGETEGGGELTKPPENGAVQWPGGGTEIPSALGVGEGAAAEALYVVLVLAGIIVSYMFEALLHKYHVSKLPGSGAIILSGVMFGALLKAVGTREAIEGAEFNEHLFALVLLPIIIFESGYALKRSYFFSQLGSIITFAIIGTTIATFFTGGALFKWGNTHLGLHRMSGEECFAFAALISAVDPVATLATFGALKVDPKLNALVYGESVINDAMAIVLYRSFLYFFNKPVNGSGVGSSFAEFWVLGLGSLVVGLFVTVLASLTLKHFPFHGSPNLEALVIVAYSYVAFAAAEANHWSGIVSSLTSGIAMAQFTVPNLSHDAKVLTGNLLSQLSQFADSIIFWFVGQNIALFSEDFDWGFVGLTILLCLVGRMLNIFPLSWLLNKWLRAKDDQITWGYQVVMWHSGLRGAIAYALAISFPSHNRGLIVSTTSVVVLFTVFGLGGSTNAMLDKFKIEKGVEVSHEENVATVKGATAESGVKAAWLRFASNVLMPWLVRDYDKRSEIHDLITSEDTHGARGAESWRGGGDFVAPLAAASVSDGAYVQMGDGNGVL